MWSARLDARVREPVSVLKIEECSTRAEEILIEPDRFLAKALISEVVMESEPVRVLRSETWWVSVEDEPKVATKYSAAPFKSVAPTLSELVRDLPMPFV